MTKSPTLNKACIVFYSCCCWMYSGTDGGNGGGCCLYRRGGGGCVQAVAGVVAFVGGTGDGGGCL